MEKKLFVSSSPHIRDGRTTQNLMLDVIIALIPALIAAFFIFGTRSIIVTAISVVACVICEYLAALVKKTKPTINDLSAVVTGILLAFNMPANVPYWIPVIGALIAIIMVKEMFGGLGNNFANPAITARIILLLSFGTEMNTFAVKSAFTEGGQGADLVTTATPLFMIKNGESFETMKLFLGQHAGTIGEVCSVALLLGLVYMLFRGVISAAIPATYVGTVALMALITGNNAINQILAGGLLLGAIFMATDYVTSPTTLKGKIIFGIGCGIITSLIRFWGISPEGVSYSILIMNILSPQIEKWTQTKPVGGVIRA